MIDKIWFVYNKGKVEGPFSYFDLEAKVCLTLDTYVWKEGFLSWQKVRDVPELHPLIASNEAPVVLDGDGNKNDEQEENQEPNVIDKPANPKDLSEDLTLAIKPEPPNLLWWLIGMSVFIYLALKLLF